MAVAAERPLIARGFDDAQLVQTLQDWLTIPEPTLYLESSPAGVELRTPTDSFLELLSKATLDPQVGPQALCKSGIDISVAWFYHRLINPLPGYIGMLVHYGFEPTDAWGEIIRFLAFRHRNGTRIIIPEVLTNRLNPCAKFKQMRNSASRTLRKLEDLPQVSYVINLVLTFPDELSRLALEDPWGLERKAWDAYRAFSTTLELALDRGQLAHQANFHPWGTSLPIEPQAHFHADLLGATRTDSSLEPLPLNRGKPLDYAQVRSLWALALSAIFNGRYCACSVSVELPFVEVCPLCLGKRVDVHLAWTRVSDKARLLHVLKYRKRSPLVDLAEFFLKNEWDPSMASHFLGYLLIYRNKSRTFGFWTRLSDNTCCCPPDTPRLPETRACPVCLKPCSISANREGSPCPICGEPCEVEKLAWEDVRDATIAFVTRKNRLRMTAQGIEALEKALHAQRELSKPPRCELFHHICTKETHLRCKLARSAVCTFRKRW